MIGIILMIVTTKMQYRLANKIQKIKSTIDYVMHVTVCSELLLILFYMPWNRSPLEAYAGIDGFIIKATASSFYRAV